MSILRRFPVAAMACTALALTLGACTQRVDPPQEPAARAAEPVHRAHHGPVFVVIDAALALDDLTPEQSTALLAVRDRFDRERRDRRVIKEQLRVSASDVVRFGTADPEAFGQTMDQAMRALEQRVDRSTKALVDVHDILQPEQRSEVADTMRAHIEQRFAQHAMREKKHERFRKIASYLVLTERQIATFERARKNFASVHHDLRPTRAELEELVSAFEREDFAVTLDAFRAKKLQLIRERAVLAADQADDVLSVLTDEQRDLLGDLIEFGPQAVGIREERR